MVTPTADPVAWVALAAPHDAIILTKTTGVGLTNGALMWSLLVFGSDLIARYVIPVGMHVGVVTGAIGGLYLMYLIYLERKKS